MRENYSSHFSNLNGGFNLIADLEPFPSTVSGENHRGGGEEEEEEGRRTPRHKSTDENEAVKNSSLAGWRLRGVGGGWQVSVSDGGQTEASLSQDALAQHRTCAGCQ